MIGAFADRIGPAAQTKATAVAAYMGYGVLSGCEVSQHATATPLAFREITHGTATTAATIDATIPGSVEVNDILFLAVMTGSGFTHTTPSGWTLVRSDTGAGTFAVRQSIYQRTAIADDAGATVTVTVSGAANILASISAYAGGDGTVVVSGGAGSVGNDTDPIAPSVTTTVDGSQIIQFYAEVGATSGSVIVPPATSRVAFDNGGYFAQGVSDQTQGSLGATGTKAATQSPAGSWVAQTVGLAPLPPAEPDMSIDVTGGNALAAGATVRVAQTLGVAVEDADPDDPRYDLVCVNASGDVVITAGTPAATPEWPEIPDGQAPLAVVLVDAGATAILDAKITDIRVLLVSNKMKTMFIEMSAATTPTTFADIQQLDLTPGFQSPDEYWGTSFGNLDDLTPEVTSLGGLLLTVPVGVYWVSIYMGFHVDEALAGHFYWATVSGNNDTDDGRSYAPVDAAGDCNGLGSKALVTVFPSGTGEVTGSIQFGLNAGSGEDDYNAAINNFSGWATIAKLPGIVGPTIPA